MSPLEGLGKLLLLFGVILVVIGLILIFGAKIPYIGRLPGDIYIKKDNFTFYFPLATSIIISIILTLILSLLNRR
ncbi:DUF2905 domain-containing protein [Thermosulfuriphilus ammonigenes]|uniref:DUF2905 domain-containing protein n=1 Tax=Thermosulfuriphilus ammonigenes TaxID=1936021 RepID=A0A6G7PX86_9BACT|nr:DUF2905 domain-containing protein [Thermosulfuriphilus ammonigenes]MBA2847659.1 cell division protein FtsW (lipid II flippase) [Thermosulfuriphilus ammonigenes]QIJ72131.1 DUF2905 domain-containing protein [Thermosulfuriphilus ammonigenes]